MRPPIRPPAEPLQVLDRKQRERLLLLGCFDRSFAKYMMVPTT